MDVLLEWVVIGLIILSALFVTVFKSDIKKKPDNTFKDKVEDVKKEIEDYGKPRVISKFKEIFKGRKKSN